MPLGKMLWQRNHWILRKKTRQENSKRQSGWKATSAAIRVPRMSLSMPMILLFQPLTRVTSMSLWNHARRESAIPLVINDVIESRIHLQDIFKESANGRSVIKGKVLNRKIYKKTYFSSINSELIFNFANITLFFTFNKILSYKIFLKRKSEIIETYYYMKFKKWSTGITNISTRTRANMNIIFHNREAKSCTIELSSSIRGIPTCQRTFSRA